MFKAIFLFLLTAPSATGFAPRVSSVAGRRSALQSTTVETVAEESTAVASNLMPRERYVATNRFEVRKGKEAAFEKRYARV